MKTIDNRHHMITRLVEAGFTQHELEHMSFENVRAEYEAAKEAGLFPLSDREKTLLYIERLKEEEARLKRRKAQEAVLKQKVEQRVARAEELKRQREEQKIKTAFVQAVAANQRKAEVERLRIIAKPVPAIANSKVCQIRDLTDEIRIVRNRIKNAAGVEFQRLADYSNSLREQLVQLQRA